MVTTNDIQAFISGDEIATAELRRWEAKRTRTVLKKFRRRLGIQGMAEVLADRTIDDVLSQPLTTQRSTLAAMKVRLGAGGVHAMLKNELVMSERIARMTVAMSKGRTRHSVVRLRVPGYSAEHFASWFSALAESSDENGLSACPDHYLLRGLGGGRQEVIETTGGSPTATRFVVDYSDVDGLTVPIDPAYPIQLAGRALLDDGCAVGGVRHQFRDHDGALEALLTVEFPGRFPSTYVAAHRWHLAVEFSNWIVAASDSAVAV
ncbi:hypothetical protein AAFP30_14890 [Gordonia sp. CPCC 205515]|uniref:hypothetical protein n=1 Tax=Gordonia sp. CPCC 205515 TaxID=3140791 RepID=UPI003AF35E2E